MHLTQELGDSKTHRKYRDYKMNECILRHVEYCQSPYLQNPMKSNKHRMASSCIKNKIIKRRHFPMSFDYYAFLNIA